jgi:hypothetical protein
MNTLWTLSNGQSQNTAAEFINLRAVCLLGLSALAALPAYSSGIQTALFHSDPHADTTGTRSGAPILLFAQLDIKHSPTGSLPPPGHGPEIPLLYTSPQPSLPPKSPPAQPQPQPQPQPQLVRPEPRAAVTSVDLGAATSQLPTNTTLSPVIRIVEILPGVQKLSESMREVPSTRQQGIEKDATAAASNDKCVSVSLRPDTQRPGLNLVDLTGDGLIVSAVPDAHIQSVFAKAGYGQVDLSQTARWCITQTAARALVRPSSGAGIQQAALLVQTGTGLQLMSQDQWVAHQASVKPLVTAMSASKPSKLNKPAYKLVAKRSSKSTTGVAVSALRLPASTSKTNAGA